MIHMDLVHVKLMTHLVYWQFISFKPRSEILLQEETDTQ